MHATPIRGARKDEKVSRTRRWRALSKDACNCCNKCISICSKCYPSKKASKGSSYIEEYYNLTTWHALVIHVIRTY